MRALPAALAMAALLLAGCSADSTTSSSTATSSAPSSTLGTTPGTQTTGATAPSANRAPAASLTATGSGLRFNFTLAASDPDGDNLTYSFDADGSSPAERTGSGPFPAQADFTYAATGLYNATFTVSDGKASTVASVRVNATAASQAPLQVADLTWTNTGAACGADYAVWSFGSPASTGAAWAELAIDPRTHGLAYQATFTYTDASGVDFAAVAMDFYAPSIDDRLDGAAPVPVPGPANPAFEYWVAGGFFEFSPSDRYEGTVPAGAAHAVFFDCATEGNTRVHYTAG